MFTTSPIPAAFLPWDQNIIEEYSNPTKDPPSPETLAKNVDVAVEEIYLFLSNQPGTIANKALEVSSLAEICFKYLKPQSLARIAQIVTLITKLPPEKLEDAVNKEFYKRLMKTFFKLHDDLTRFEKDKSTEKLAQVQPPMPKATVLKHSASPPISSTPKLLLRARSSTEPPKLTAKKISDDDIKKDQIKNISDFVHLFMEHYVPFYDQGNSLYKKTLLAKFDKLFPSFVDKFFFHDPQGLTEMNKQLIISSLQLLYSFLHTFNQKTEVKKGQGSGSENCPQALPVVRVAVNREPQQIERFNLGDYCSDPMVEYNPTPLTAAEEDELKKLREEELKYQQDKEKSQAARLDKTQVKIEEIIRMFTRHLQSKETTPENNLLEFYEFALSMFIAPLVNVLSSPYFICLMIDKIFLKTFKMPDILDETPAPINPCALDARFNKEVGSLINNIGLEVIAMGRPSGPMSLVIGAFKIYMGRNGENWAEELQKSLINLCQSKCTITPILFLRALLFDESQTPTKPAFSTKHLNSSYGIEAFQSHVYSMIQNKLHQTVMKLVETYTNTPTRWAVENVGSLKNFCNNLSVNMYNFATQDETADIILTMISKMIEAALVVNEKPKTVIRK